MSEIKFKDIGKITTREETPEGFLSVIADFARTGVQEYFAGELPRDQLPEQFRDNPRAKIHILRSADEVFKSEVMNSFASKPVTNGHPSKFVDKSNFRKVVVGTTRHKVERNDNKLRVGLVLQDAQIIDEVNAGKNQLSAGYSSHVLWDSGTDPVFGVYDAIQTRIRGNHIAVVSQARGGPELKINDSWPMATKPKEGKPMGERTINGFTIEFADRRALEAVDHLVTEAEQASGKVAAIEAQLSDSKKEVERLQGELDALKATQLTDEQIDAKVRDRIGVIDSARRLFPEVETEGKSDIEIKVAAIQHVNTALDLTDKKPEYVDGVFSTLVANAPDQSKVSMKQAIKGAQVDDGKQPDVAGDARREFMDRNAKAWRFEGGTV